MEQENDLQKISDLVDSEIQKIESVQDSIRKLIDALAYGLASKLLDYISMAADIFLSTFIIFCILVVGSFTYKMIGWLPGSDPQITEYINSGSRVGAVFTLTYLGIALMMDLIRRSIINFHNMLSPIKRKSKDD